MRNVIALLLAGILAGCAGSRLHYDPGLQLLGKPTSARPPELRPPSAVIQADFAAEFVQPRGNLRFTLRALYDTTSDRGRLVASGPLGINLATVIWTGGNWQAYFPNQSTLVMGSGDTIALPVLGIQRFRISEMSDYLAGRFLPRRTASSAIVTLQKEQGKRTLLGSRRDGSRWSATIEEKTGLPKRLQEWEWGREISRTDFDQYAATEGRIHPRFVRRHLDSGRVLDLRLRSIRFLGGADSTLFRVAPPLETDTITVTKKNGKNVVVVRSSSARPESERGAVPDSAVDGDSLEVLDSAETLDSIDEAEMPDSLDDGIDTLDAPGDEEQLEDSSDTVDSLEESSLIETDLPEDESTVDDAGEATPDPQTQPHATVPATSSLPRPSRVQPPPPSLPAEDPLSPELRIRPPAATGARGARPPVTAVPPAAASGDRSDAATLPVPLSPSGRATF